LGKWLAEEQYMVNQKIVACGDIIESFAAIGLEKTMNMANNLSFT
jgi:PTH1 family peptidyl-tRNA hydrolase